MFRLIVSEWAKAYLLAFDVDKSWKYVDLSIGGFNKLMEECIFLLYINDMERNDINDISEIDRKDINDMDLMN